MGVILTNNPVIVTTRGVQLTDSWSLGYVSVLIPLIWEDFLIICVARPCRPLLGDSFPTQARILTIKLLLVYMFRDNYFASFL